MLNGTTFDAKQRAGNISRPFHCLRYGTWFLYTLRYRSDFAKQKVCTGISIKETYVYFNLCNTQKLQVYNEGLRNQSGLTHKL